MSKSLESVIPSQSEMSRNMETLRVLIGVLIAYPLLTTVKAELCSLKEDSSKCLSQALQNLLPSLVNGIPKYGVLPLDPLSIELLDLSDKPGKLLNVKHKFHKVKMTGLKSSVVKEVRADLAKAQLNIDVVYKKPVILTGTYESEGKILTLPIKGDGPFNITLIGVQATLKMKGHQNKNKNGKTHIKMDEAKFLFKADRMIVDFKDLLKGNPVISETINSILNENWKPVLDDMKDSFGEGIGATFREVANRAFLKVPLEELVQY